jgi:hypothetical protein
MAPDPLTAPVDARAEPISLRHACPAGGRSRCRAVRIRGLLGLGIKGRNFWLNRALDQSTRSCLSGRASAGGSAGGSGFFGFTGRAAVLTVLEIDVSTLS